MYILLCWYAWGFGKWQCLAQSKTIEELEAYRKKNKISWCFIVKDKRVIREYGKIHTRPGMCMPKFNIYHDKNTGETIKEIKETPSQ